MAETIRDGTGSGYDWKINESGAGLVKLQDCINIYMAGSVYGDTDNYLLFDGTNNVWEFFIAGSKVCQINLNGDLKISGQFYEGVTF